MINTQRTLWIYRRRGYRTVLRSWWYRRILRVILIEVICWICHSMHPFFYINRPIISYKRKNITENSVRTHFYIIFKASTTGYTRVMYFVSAKKRLTSNTFLFHLLPTGAVLITLISISLLGWHNAKQALATEKQNVTTNYATSTRDSILERLSTYEVVLKGAAGLFISSSEVTREEWKHYIASFDLQQRYPGIQSVGYITYVAPEQVDTLTQIMRSQGLPDFHIFPEGNRPMYTSVLYVEPQRATTGFGYDMLAEPDRGEAMLRAQRTGQASLTGKLTFIQNASQLSSNSGFTMYTPVYASAAEPKPQAVKGFAFAPFIGSNLFKGVLGDVQDEKYALRIYDTEAQDDKAIYQTENYTNLAANTDAFSHTMPMELYGRKWILDFRFSADVIAENTRNRPITSLISGIVLSLLLSGFVLSLLIARTRALGHTKQLELQNAKDELLSLASHQLRTPATSVKQYTAMLREGFAGELTKDQKTLVDKAYESNERQLHIINQLLYVAKIDANGIVLTPRRINANSLLQDLTNELSHHVKDRKARIRLQVPARRLVYLEADEHCLRMALENLIGNALKYSLENALVTVKLSQTKDVVRIAIKDKGVGIADDELEMLFQRFTRIPNELSNQTSGSGIGLYLSQQLIDLHQGRIEVESVKGKGTTFTVILPKKQNT